MEASLSLLIGDLTVFVSLRLESIVSRSLNVFTGRLSQSLNLDVHSAGYVIAAIAC
jgi:hypothetical protein